MNAPDLLDHLARWHATVELGEGDRVVLHEYDSESLPRELLETCRGHKQELLVWLRWERAAGVLWEAVFGRMAARADLADDADFQALVAVADAAHLRHDRAALVDALFDLESLARATGPEEKGGTSSAKVDRAVLAWFDVDFSAAVDGMTEGEES